MEINKTAALLKPHKITSNTEANIAGQSVKKGKADIHIGDAKMLDEANLKLNKMYEVDINKVQQVKQAISEGKISINLANLSKAISDEHLLGMGNNE